MSDPTVKPVSDSALTDLYALTDQCVKCGLCLSTCPTYLLQPNEADSPRGRLALIQALVNQQVQADDKKLRQHLDECLGCGNCETACPSGVAVIDLLDQAKNLFALSPVSKWQIDLFASGKLLATASNVAKIIPQSFGSLLPGILQESFKQKSNALGKIELTSAPAKSKSRVGVFTGCIGKAVDANAINLTSQLLVNNGYEVVVPKEQGCCGAMHQHEGYLTDADSLLSRNLKAFNSLKLDAIIYFASGCGAQLQKRLKQFNVPVLEVTEFLASVSLPEVEPAGSEKIVIHSPCTLRNHGNSWPVMLELVRKLAGHNLIELPDNHLCCGSAGLHMLKHPHKAMAYMQPKLASLKEIKPDVLLTANTGCALHFKNAIRDSGLDIHVMHPSEWVSKRLLTFYK